MSYDEQLSKLVDLFKDADEFTVRQFHSLLLDAERYCDDRSQEPYITDSTGWRYKYERWLKIEQELLQRVVNPRNLYKGDKS